MRLKILSHNLQNIEHLKDDFRDENCKLPGQNPKIPENPWNFYTAEKSVMFSFDKFIL